MQQQLQRGFGKVQGDADKVKDAATDEALVECTFGFVEFDMSCKNKHSRALGCLCGQRGGKSSIILKGPG